MEKPFLRKVFFPRPLFQKFGVVFRGGYYFTMLLAFPRTMGRYKYDGVCSKDCGLIKCTIYKTDIYKVPFRGSTERAPTKTKKLSLVVEQKKLNNLRDKVKFRLRLRLRST